MREIKYENSIKLKRGKIKLKELNLTEKSRQKLLQVKSFLRVNINSRKLRVMFWFFNKHVQILYNMIISQENVANNVAEWETANNSKY